MNTVFTTLMAKCPTNDIGQRIKRAQSILKSFAEEIANQLSPPLPISIEFRIEGKPIKFEMSVDEITCAIDILHFVSEAISEIKSIADISHYEFYRRVFTQGAVHESSHQAFSGLTQAFREAIGDQAYIDNLRSQNVVQSQ